MSATNRKTPEPLTHLIRRIVTDCRAVGQPCTPTLLADAIAAAGWHHDQAPVHPNGSHDRVSATNGRNTE